MGLSPSASPRSICERRRPPTRSAVWMPSGFTLRAMPTSRCPPPWDLDLYLRNAKPGRVGRPFGSRQAAEDLGAMLRKSGWVNVCVMELKREHDR